MLLGQRVENDHPFFKQFFFKLWCGALDRAGRHALHALGEHLGLDGAPVRRPLLAPAAALAGGLGKRIYYPSWLAK
jgi:hypothetical protein